MTGQIKKWSHQNKCHYLSQGNWCCCCCCTCTCTCKRIKAEASIITIVSPKIGMSIQVENRRMKARTYWCFNQAWMPKQKELIRFSVIIHFFQNYKNWTYTNKILHIFNIQTFAFQKCERFNIQSKFSTLLIPVFVLVYNKPINNSMQLFQKLDPFVWITVRSVSLPQ